MVLFVASFWIDDNGHQLVSFIIKISTVYNFIRVRFTLFL